MPWAETIRRRSKRKNDRYSSDTTDQEWTVLSPLLPDPKPPKETPAGRRERMERLAKGLLAATGCRSRCSETTGPSRRGRLVGVMHRTCLLLRADFFAFRFVSDFRRRQPIATVQEFFSDRSSETKWPLGSKRNALPKRAGKPPKGSRRNLRDTGGEKRLSLQIVCVHCMFLLQSEGSITMDHKQFQEWLSWIDEPSPAQWHQAEAGLSGGSEASASLAAIEGSVDEDRRCPHCGTPGAISRGKARGLRRYRCKGCRKTFVNRRVKWVHVAA